MTFRSVMKKTAISVGALVAAALLSGATYEQVMRHRVVEHIAAPGKLIDIGNGRRLQLDCRGAGSPTVVLESGLDGNGSLAWAAVQDSIAKTTRVCSYSRPGIMWSDPVSGKFDSRAVAHDLHAALIGAGESAPFILAGHSIGGPLITVFTHMYDREVVGLVYVDPSHPDQFEGFREVTGKLLAPSPTIVQVGSLLAWTGLVRLLPAEESPPSWPKNISAVAPAFLPTTVNELRREVEAVPSILSTVDTMRTLGDRPVVVLTAAIGNSPEMLKMMGITAEQGNQARLVSQRLHIQMASWSTRGRQETVPGASHYIQFDRPDVVIRTVNDMVHLFR